MPLLFLNGLTVLYHTYKMKRYYTPPNQVEVFAYEQKLRDITTAENEVKNKLNDALKSGTK